MRALLVHGLQSSAAGWWQVESWLADAGWEVETRNLLGHGGRGPASDYSFAAYADDLDDDHRSWDLVVAHSLGGAIATVIAARRPGWAARLVLVDPALVVPDAESAELIRDLELEQLTDAEALRAAHPLWHPDDIAAKVFSLSGVDTNATRGTVTDNQPWDLRGEVARLSVPTLLLTGDPAVYTMDSPELVAELVAANPALEYRTIEGAGHSPHRDQPEATRAALREWLSL